MKSHPLCCSLVITLLILRLGFGQEFDEKYDHWPERLKIGGTVVIHNQLSNAETVQNACLQFIPKTVEKEKAQHLECTIIHNQTDASEYKKHFFSEFQGDFFSTCFHLQNLDVGKLEKSLRKSNLVILDFQQNEFLNSKKTSLISKSLKSFLENGKVLLANAEAGKWISSVVVDGFPRSPEIHSGMDLIPDTVIETHFSTPEDERYIFSALAINPRKVGIGIYQNTCLVFQGRKLFTYESGKAKLLLAANESQSRRIQVIGINEKAKNRRDFEFNLADLTQWRRDAIDRTLPPFPKAKPKDPIVENGTLVIVGGGGMPENLMADFVKMAGGNEAHMVYVPCAESDTVSSRQRTVESWEKLGVKSATFIHTKDRQRANSDPAILLPLKKATGIWFGGGRQWNFSDSYYGTEAHRLMKEVLRKGGVIGGSSAGASIQARYLARATPIANYKIMAFGYERGGLGFISGVAIDQHFTQRGRQKDMTELMKCHPQLLGIGIDEATAIIVNKSEAKVVGRGNVHFYDRRLPVTPGKNDFIALPSGSIYDLKERKIVVNTSKPLPESDQQPVD